MTRSGVRNFQRAKALERSVLEIATTPHVRTEKDEERLCDQLVARLGPVGQVVVRFSQPRNTMQTLGIADRRYRVHGLPILVEAEARGRLALAEQIVFLRTEARLRLAGRRRHTRGLGGVHSRARRSPPLAPANGRALALGVQARRCARHEIHPSREAGPAREAVTEPPRNALRWACLAVLAGAMLLILAIRFT